MHENGRLFEIRERSEKMFSLSSPIFLLKRRFSPRAENQLSHSYDSKPAQDLIPLEKDEKFLDVFTHSLRYLSYGLVRKGGNEKVRR